MGTEEYLPNRFGRILLLSLEETLGVPGFQAVLSRAGLRHLAVYPPDDLQRAFPASHIPRLMVALEDLHGVGKGRELAAQAGAACFRRGLVGFGVLSDLAGLVLPLLPIRTRARVGLETVAEMFHRLADTPIRVEVQDGLLLWVMEHCDICLGRTTTTPCCHLIAGLLQATTRWATGKNSATVTEVACAATGEPHCVMEINLS